jgi:hypothetical protein
MAACARARPAGESCFGVECRAVRGSPKRIVMRSDMSKVIVERPRLRIPLKNGSAYPRGHLENRWAPDFENAPRIESMGRAYGKKWLNENLQPLVRFLRSRVGRRWDDVHSEIAAQISCNSAVQKHVLDHLRHYVVESVRIVGTTVEHLGYRGYEPLRSHGMNFCFYVHPDTRELCLAPIAPRKRKKKVDPDRLVLARDRELRRINGIWYEIEVAPIPRDPFARAACFDVVERTVLDGRDYDRGARENVLWQAGRYAARKRQLSTREINRHSLPRPR